jgi:hypothetical protein
MSTTRHFVVSVRGMLHRSDRELRQDLKYTTKSDGTKYASVQELRSALMDELAQGHEVLPTGPCDNHDWKKGCQGHETETTTDPA